MQNPSSSVSSGNISPAIVGTDKGTKEVYVIGWVVLGLARSEERRVGKECA